MRESRFMNARLGEEPVSITVTRFGYPGAMPSISADGSRNGIVWASENGERCYTPMMRMTWRMNFTTATKRLREEITSAQAISSSRL